MEAHDISSSAATLQEQTIKIEVYEFPNDCTVHEILYQFERAPYKTKCLSHHKMSSSYILEYSAEEAERILAQPEQLLYEDDEKTKIWIRRVELPRTIIVTSKETISERLLKKYFRDNYAAVDSCEVHQHDSHQYIITFRDSSAMEEFKVPKKMIIGGLEVEARLLEICEDEDEDSQTSLQTVYTLENKEVHSGGLLVGDTMELLKFGPAGDMVHDTPDMTESDPSIGDSPVSSRASSRGATKVLMETTLSEVVFKKFIKSKSKGTLTNTLSEGRYLVEYDTYQDAKKMVDKKTVEWGGNTLIASYYLPEDDSDGDSINVETDTTLVATHIEVKMPHCEVSAKEFHQLLHIHFDEVFGCEDGEYTTFEISWDEDMQLFRFDLSPTEISMLTKSPQSILIGGNEILLDMTACYTGRNVMVQPAGHMTKHFSKAQLHASLGANSHYKAEMKIVQFLGDKAELEFSSHSFAARLGSKRRVRLKKGTEVKVQFATEMTDSETESDSDESPEDEEEHLVTTIQGAKMAPIPAPRLSQKIFERNKNHHGNSMTTLLVRNVLDVDAETINFWVKSLLNVWPISIQLAANGEDAVVKMPHGCNTSNLQNSQREEFQLYSEILEVSEIEPTVYIQVMCQSTEPGGTIDMDTLEAYFSHSKYTGLERPTALQSISPKGSQNGLPVFVVAYSSPCDVQLVISRSPHKHGRWSFDVAEFYPNLDVCSPGSLWIRNDSSTGQDVDRTMSAPQPVLHIVDIDEQVHMETLKHLMGSRKRCDGGAISSWQEGRSQNGHRFARVIYEDPSVAQRVYDAYLSHPLRLGDRALQLKLELPWFTSRHDPTKLRVSGLGSDVDAEKLRFYLSALSGNVATEILFNASQTCAIASFIQPLDYWALICCQQSTPLKDCPNIELAQEYKATSLVATGDLVKESIELVLESTLGKKFRRDIDVYAEELPGTTDMWRIVSEHEEFLGIDVTHGVCKKSEQLKNLIGDSLTLRFLTKVSAGHDKLVRFLQLLGLKLSADGVITMDTSSSRHTDRTSLKNWKKLRHHIDRFVQEELIFHRMDKLTQQVYEKLKAQVPQIVIGQPVVTGVESSTNAIAVVGAKEVVEPLKMKLARAVEQIEKEIQVEKTVKEVVIPNVLDYQINYLKSIDFFNAKRNEYQLVSFTSDISARRVTIKAIPRSVEAVQMEMLDLLPQIALSKVAMRRKPIFWKIFKTESASQAIRQQMESKQIRAVWNVENKTVSVYSESKAISQSALDCISHAIWEEQYPANGPLDDLERQLLSSDLWTKKKSELQQLCQPLEIMEIEDDSKLWMAGLAQSRAIVQEIIAFFFVDHVQRTSTFTGTPNKVLFLNRFATDMLKDLEHENHVKLGKKNEDRTIEITGTKDNIATCGRRLQELHDSVTKDMYVVDHQAMIMFINENYDILESVGFRTKCVVSLHRDDAPVEAGVSVLGGNMPSDGSQYSVTLPNGTVCVVKCANIVTMTCDAIVNAANDKLEHIGGLALAIVQRGGNSIQQECSDYIRREGTLFEGQVFTSGAGTLYCKKIIHAVGPRWKDGYSQEGQTLFTCIDNCFDETEKHRLQSVAIPPISTGIFGYPLEKAVKTIVEALRDRHQRGGYLPQRIVFVDNKTNSLKMFEDELRKAYGQQAMPMRQFHHAMPLVSSSSATGASSKYTVNGNTIRVLNKLNIEIKHGDIAAADVHTLVNSVGEQLDLTAGKVAQAIAAKAGAQLQAACSQLAPMKVGEIKETDGFRLKCKKVLHVFCPQWKGPASALQLKQLVIACMMKAASNGHQSVAFPALGTGTLSYPKDEVAKVMIQSLIEYAEKHNGSISEVKICVYHRDEPTKKSFADELQRLSNPGVPQQAMGIAAPRQTPRRKLDPELDSVYKGAAPNYKKPLQQQTDGVWCVTVHKTRIRVLQGDISQHQADVLVNCTDSSLGMDGSVSKALLSKAGDLVRDEVFALSFTASKKGLWTSSAGKLPAKQIFHIDTQSAGRDHDRWQKIISFCLKNCDAQKLTSIAFPALGTGVLEIPSSEMAEIMLKSLITYIDKHSKTNLHRIDIVLFQHHMVNDFVCQIKNAKEKKQPWWARLKVKVSEWVGGSVEGIKESQSHEYKLPELSDTDFPELKLDIYGNAEEDIRRCKDELGKRLDKEIVTTVLADKEPYRKYMQYIPKLTQSQQEKLCNTAKRLHVKLEISKQLRNIKVVGLRHQVSEMCELVSYELHQLEMAANDQREATLIAKSVQWVYEDGSGGWVNFHPLINKALEQTYQENPKGRYQYTSSKGTVSLDLSRMQGTDDSRTPFKIKRADLTVKSALGPSVAIPSTWQAPHDTYREVTLTPATPEYNEVEKGFMRTLGAGGNNVLEIRRVQNPSLYQHYMLMRKDVAKNLKIPEDKVEQVLWHGTKEDAVTKIASGKFDRGLAGENAAMYGMGCYFATTVAYSTRFATPNSRGHKYMIQTRVVTGEWCQGKQQLKAAPAKANGEPYDSVVDDMNKPSMFVVFDDNSAYPQYIIKFQ